MDKPADPSAQSTIALIMPVLNEAERIESSLSDLPGYDQVQEVVVVDGGSEDGTPTIAARFADDSRRTGKRAVLVLNAGRGRAAQMNSAARLCRSDILLFVHADTRLPTRAPDLVREAMQGNHVWGRFDVRLEDNGFVFRLIEWLMNWRSALTGIATGDQAIFVWRTVFDSLGGYARIDLMEDIELCKRLKKVGRPARIREKAAVSTRRWRCHGIIRTVLLMWMLRLLYWLGIPGDRLARLYSDMR